MSPGLRDLLTFMREHPSFPELLKMVTVPEAKPFSPRGEKPASEQFAEWTFRSGQQRQHDQWLHALTELNPPQGGVTEPSQQE